MPVDTTTRTARDANTLTDSEHGQVPLSFTVTQLSRHAVSLERRYGRLANSALLWLTGRGPDRVCFCFRRMR